MKDNQNNKPYLISWITYSKHQLNNILKFHLYILYEEFVKKMNICSLYIYYIKWCLRTFAPISWCVRSEGLDKSITCTDLSGFIQDEIDSISQGTFSASNCHYIFNSQHWLILVILAYQTFVSDCSLPFHLCSLLTCQMQ